ncbi:MAG TPA: GMC family oxidoreductase, partial [Arenibacter sp.]|nr:GMC family oxidoreductase [Arenibacter sp.]
MNQSEMFDAIVVGTGISGGWAAKELCESGLKTLVLERGPMVKHIEDYRTMNDDPWDYPLKGKLSKSDKEKYHIQSRLNWAPDESNKHFFVNDLEHP